MSCYCCVLNCKNSKYRKAGMHFFRFPKKDVKRQNLWKRFTRRKNAIKPTNVICEDHFEDKYVSEKKKNMKLSKDAVPTLYWKFHDDIYEKVEVPYDGDDYFGEEAVDMDQTNEDSAIEATKENESLLIKEQLRYEELKLRCRFCAETKEENIDIKCFESYNINIHALMEHLHLATNITNNKHLSSKVCEECFHQVSSLDAFIIKCKNAEQFLAEELSKLNPESLVQPPKNPKLEVVLVKEEFDNENEEDDEAEDTIEETQEYQDPTFVIEQDDNNYESEGGRSSEYLIQFKSKQEVIVEEVIPMEPKVVKEVSKFPPMTPSKMLRLEMDVYEDTVENDVIINRSLNKFSTKVFECQYCKKKYGGKKTFKFHKCVIEKIQCEECEKVLDCLVAYQTHKKFVHGGEQFKNYCPICKTVITGNNTLFKKHRSKCNKERTNPIECELCSKVCTTLHGYTIHKMFHETKAKEVVGDELIEKGRKPRPKETSESICELCGKSYKNLRDCRRHMKIKHTKTDEIFRCNVCQKVYPSLNGLKDHVRNTHVINEVQCTQCGKSFRNNTHLKKHMIYHDPTRKVHKCFICPDQPGYVSRVSLLRHQAKHGVDRAFSCDYCSSSYSSKQQLKIHITSRHEEHLLSENY